jgi:Tfp pilus assembly protein PilZ
VSSDLKQRRRDKRYRTELTIRTRLAGKPVELLVEDVSFRGLFIVTKESLPLRQLMKIEANLPPNGTLFATHAMVVYVVAPGDPTGHTPGAGAQFYGMGDERRAWEAYVQHVQRSTEAMPDRRNAPAATPEDGARPAVAARPPTIPAVPQTRAAAGSGPQDSRRFARAPIVLEIRPRDLEELLRMYSRDVSVGGMFLSTAREIEVGAELRIDVRHPHSDTVFQLQAVVRRRTTQPLGIGIEFTEVDDKRRREFLEFIHASIPVDDDEVELELVENE